MVVIFSGNSSSLAAKRYQALTKKFVKAKSFVSSDSLPSSTIQECTVHDTNVFTEIYPMNSVWKFDGDNILPVIYDSNAV